MRSAGLWLVLISSTAAALPPGSTFREGANHHVGDASFVAARGRAPGPRDTEHERMQLHLRWIRAELAGKPATRPGLAARRAELLGYLDAYIAQGITPKNWALPWRTPVFIDDRGAICAVGYLIERSVGRALPEKIAASHRYAFLEEIAAAMPEVAAWIEGSGFTLDELASIQPGYTEPQARTWQRWTTRAIPDGPYRSGSMRESAAVGTFARRQMQGEWRTYAADLAEDRMPRESIDERAAVIGRGRLVDGAGAWTSYHDDGALLARGRFANSQPNGTWRFYHRSGNLAAIGEMWNGMRAGRWEFFHDTPRRTPIARGAFSARGKVIGSWRHFDQSGRLIAVSHTETLSAWKRSEGIDNNSEGEVIDIVPGADRIRHAISIGTRGGVLHRLDTFALGDDRVYVHPFPWAGTEDVYDARGNLLAKVDGRWTAASCGWGATRLAAAQAGDVARLHDVLFQDRQRRGFEHPEPACRTPRPISAERARRLEALLASRDKVRAVPPAFVRALVLGDTKPEYLAEDTKAEAEDMARVIVEHMGFYVEWPHIDGRFIAVFRTLPGHVRRYWWDTM